MNVPLIHAWRVAVLCCAIALAGCGTMSGPSQPGKRGGGYYLDDGPGDNPPANLDAIPDAVPRLEPIVRGTTRPYTVMGRTYTPMMQLSPYRQRGLATWYGRRYHGNRTASGEVYDMYAMTGAHPVLPIPSYARVTNVHNGRSVVVRINDRGPFLGDRVIDLSYAAAHKLDIVRNGSALVDVEAILPGDPAPARTVNAAAPPAATPAANETPMSVATAAPAPSGAVTVPTATALPAAAASGEEPASDAASGFYLQLGAFALRDNAERFLERMRLALATVDANLTIDGSANLHRVQVGPYPSRDSALQAAERIGQSIGSPPLLVGPR